MINTDSPFALNGTISSKTESGKTTKTETGVLNGVAYRIKYSDGSAAFTGKKGVDAPNPFERENWFIVCEARKGNPSNRCVMTNRSLAILVSGNKTQVVVNPPSGKSSSVSIGIGGKFYTTLSKNHTFTAAESQPIIEKLKTATTVTTRSQGQAKDETWGLYGFNEVYRYANWALSKMK